MRATWIGTVRRPGSVTWVVKSFDENAVPMGRVLRECGPARSVAGDAGQLPVLLMAPGSVTMNRLTYCNP